MAYKQRSKESMSPINLIGLHTILIEMVRLEKITQYVALDFLATAGMIQTIGKVDKNGVSEWIDEDDNIYGLPQSLTNQK